MRFNDAMMKRKQMKPYSTVRKSSPMLPEKRVVIADMLENLIGDYDIEERAWKWPSVGYRYELEALTPVNFRKNAGQHAARIRPIPRRLNTMVMHVHTMNFDLTAGMRQRERLDEVFDE